MTKRNSKTKIKVTVEMGYKIAIVSDTHGLIREEVLTKLKTNPVELIIHAGDIGTKQVLDKLNSISRVIAVRGNTDYDGWMDEQIEIFRRDPGRRKTHLCCSSNR